MTDTLMRGQVDRPDRVGGKENAVLAVAIERADGDALAGQGFRHVPQAAFEADAALGGGNDAGDLALVEVMRGRCCGMLRGLGRKRSAGTPSASASCGRSKL